jgi:hypothetical protein
MRLHEGEAVSFVHVFVAKSGSDTDHGRIVE